MRCPTIRRIRATSGRRRSRRSTRRSWAAPSIRCCARATRIAGSQRPSRPTPARIRIRWASGAATRRRTSRTWTAGDFYGSEQSAVIADAGSLRIELTGADGATTVLKEGIKVDANDVVGASVMSRRALQAFFARIDRRRAGGGHPALTAPEGHDDEGVRSDHVRTRGA